MNRGLNAGLAVAALLCLLPGGFLLGAASLRWLGIALVVVGFFTLLLTVMTLWKGVSAFFGAVAVAVVVIGTSVVQGHPLWLSAFGETRTDCRVLDSRHVRSSSSASYTVHTVQCGDLRIEYEPYQTASEHIGDVGEETSLVFDRTGLMNPVRPSDVSGASWWPVPAGLLLGSLFVAFAATRRPREQDRGSAG